MTDPKSKSEKLSKTCISYLEQRVKENYYGRRKILKTGAIQKGIECEQEAIYVLNKALSANYKKSDSAKLENERCTGHEDIDGGNYTIDTKVCETFDTFPILKEDVDKMYWWQGQAYMWLKGEQYKKHTVAKVLVNSPAWLVRQELYYAYNALDRKYEGRIEYIEEEFEQQAQEIFLNHVFDKQLSVDSGGMTFRLSDDQVIPYDKRVNIVTFERDDEAIVAIAQRVQECRDYLEMLGY